MDADRPVTEVPDVVGMGAADACSLIRAARLEPYAPVYGPAPTIGVIAAQVPVGAAGAVEGDPVFLWTQEPPHSGDPVSPQPTESAPSPL